MRQYFSVEQWEKLSQKDKMLLDDISVRMQINFHEKENIDYLLTLGSGKSRYIDDLVTRDRQGRYGLSRDEVIRLIDERIDEKMKGITVQQKEETEKDIEDSIKGLL